MQCKSLWIKVSNVNVQQIVIFGWTITLTGLLTSIDNKGDMYDP